MKLPVVRATEVAKALKRLGFVLQRQRGSHMFFRHPDGRTTVLPNHPSETLDRGLLGKIIKHDLRMQRKDFLQYLK